MPEQYTQAASKLTKVARVQENWIPLRKFGDRRENVKVAQKLCKSQFPGDYKMHINSTYTTIVDKSIW